MFTIGDGDAIGPNRLAMTPCLKGNCWESGCRLMVVAGESLTSTCGNYYMYRRAFMLASQCMGAGNAIAYVHNSAPMTVPRLPLALCTKSGLDAPSCSMTPCKSIIGAIHLGSPVGHRVCSWQGTYHDGAAREVRSTI